MMSAGGGKRKRTLATASALYQHCNDDDNDEHEVLDTASASSCSSVGGGGDTAAAAAAAAMTTTKHSYKEQSIRLTEALERVLRRHTTMVRELQHVVNAGVLRDAYARASDEGHTSLRDACVYLTSAATTTTH